MLTIARQTPTTEQLEILSQRAVQHKRPPWPESRAVKHDPQRAVKHVVVRTDNKPAQRAPHGLSNEQSSTTHKAQSSMLLCAPTTNQHKRSPLPESKSSQANPQSAVKHTHKNQHKKSLLRASELGALLKRHALTAAADKVLTCTSTSTLRKQGATLQCCATAPDRHKKNKTASWPQMHTLSLPPT